MGRLPLLLGLIPFLLLPAACAPRRIAESILLGSHFEMLGDVSYGPAPQHRLDLYRPRGTRSAVPVVVFLHGGRWQHGSREEYRLLGDALTREGVVAVVPDSRRYPEVRFPVWVEDAARAVRWVRDSIAAFGGDPRRIFVMGHSSGAHTASAAGTRSSLPPGRRSPAIRRAGLHQPGRSGGHGLDRSRRAGAHGAPGAVARDLSHAAGRQLRPAAPAAAWRARPAGVAGELHPARGTDPRARRMRTGHRVLGSGSRRHRPGAGAGPVSRSHRCCEM